MQAHNLTPEEMEELRFKQRDGEVEKVKANIESDYEIPAVETHMIHAELEIKNFDQSTGAKTSTPKVQTFYPKEFDDMKKTNGFKGYSVKVIHDPRVIVEQSTDDNDGGGNAGGLSKKEQAALEKQQAKELKALRAEYKSYYKEEADEALTKEDLVDLINLKKNPPQE
jgi:hypothetical protein